MSLIENNYGTVNVSIYGSEATPENIVASQIKAGASEEVLEDIGYSTDIPASVTADESPTSALATKQAEASDTLDAATFKRLAAEVIMHDVTLEDDDHSMLRAMNLQSVAGDKRLVSKARKREGFLTVTEPEPDDRKRVEELYVDARRRAAINLRRACGHCALRDRCRIYKEPIEGPDVPKHEIVTPARAAEVTLNRWIKRHPYADRAENREQRPRNQFSRELDENPLKNCRPDTAKR